MLPAGNGSVVFVDVDVLASSGREGADWAGDGVPPIPKKVVSFLPGGANWEGGGGILSPTGVCEPFATILSLLWA
jgi:hypothetical protein